MKDKSVTIKVSISFALKKQKYFSLKFCYLFKILSLKKYICSSRTKNMQENS